MIEAVPEDERSEARGDGARSTASSPSDAIIASNTSSIPIAELAQAIRDPERVLGLHFFSPVPVMKLVEVVVALDTREHGRRAPRRFVERIGKRPIETKDRSGFIVNMLLVPYLMAAVRMYEEGFASREDIDDGMKLGCGHPMGPLTLCDFIGLDVLYAVCDSLYEEFKRDRVRAAAAAEANGRQRPARTQVRRGFYDYSSAIGRGRPSLVRQPPPSVRELVERDLVHRGVVLPGRQRGDPHQVVAIALPGGVERDPLLLQHSRTPAPAWSSLPGRC